MVNVDFPRLGLMVFSTRSDAALKMLSQGGGGVKVWVETSTTIRICVFLFDGV